MKKNKKTSKGNRISNSVLELVVENSEKMDNLVGIVNDMIKNNPDFSGGLQVEVTLDNNKSHMFYMVSDMFVNEPFLEFYHLVPSDPDNKEFSLKSFGEKTAKQSLHAFIKKTGKEKRWNRVHEQIHIQTIARVQTIGYHTYSKSWLNQENNPNLLMSKGEVIPLDKHRK